MYNERQVDDVFDTAYSIGQADERKRSQERDEQLRRLAEACEAQDDGDSGPMDELMRQAGIRPADELFDVAGATPLELSGSGQLADEIERWLREQ